MDEVLIGPPTVDSLEYLIADVTGKVESLESAVGELEMKQEELENEISSLGSLCRSLKSANKRLDGELSTARFDIERLGRR